MQPFCEIAANGTDITAKLMDYLLSVEVQDEAEDKSDTITITLDDRSRYADGAILEIPLIGTVISVTMGYRNGKSRSLGSYKIDEISVQPSPRTLTLTGRAAGMNTSYRTPRSQSYHQQTMGTIMGDIAQRHGLEAKIDPQLAGIVVRHIDQHKESDMGFATRLAGDYDAVAKPVDGKLVVAKRGTGKAITGEDLPTIYLTESMCSNWGFKYSARDEAGEADGLETEGESDQKAAGNRLNNSSNGADSAANSTVAKKDASEETPKGGVRAFYHDIRTAVQKAVMLGNEPYHDLRYSAHNEVEAKAQIAAYQNKSMRGKASFDCEVGGDPFMMAEALLIHETPFRPYIPTHWRIKKVSHRFDSGGGYVSSCECELYAPQQQDTVKTVQETSPAKDDLIDEDAPQEPLTLEDLGISFEQGGASKKTITTEEGLTITIIGR